MAFERNDIVNDVRLMAALGSSEMGFDHNDFVTVDKMNAAIAEGGGGGGDYNSLTMTAIGDDGELYAYAIQRGDYYPCIFATEDGFNTNVSVADGVEKVITVLYNGDSVSISVPPTVTEVSGDATYDSGTETLTATGDFTIKGRYAD